MRLDVPRLILKMPRVNAETITADRLRWRLTDVAERIVGGSRFVVTHYGKPKFAVVSLADLERIGLLPDVTKGGKRKRSKPK